MLEETNPTQIQICKPISKRKRKTKTELTHSQPKQAKTFNRQLNNLKTQQTKA